MVIPIRSQIVHDRYDYVRVETNIPIIETITA